MVDNLFLYIYLMCMSVLLKCVSVHHVSAGAFGGQWRTLNPLNPELWMVVSYRVGPL